MDLVVSGWGDGSFRVVAGWFALLVGWGCCEGLCGMGCGGFGAWCVVRGGGGVCFLGGGAVGR